LAIEGLGTADELAHRFADRILVDDLNRRCLDRSTAATLIREHQARQAATAAAAAERDQEFRVRIAAQLDPIQAHVKAIQSRQAQLRDAGVIDDDTPALAVMCGADKAADLDAAGRRFDALFAGQSTGYRISPNPTKE
jgi:hypothetical protein